MNRGIWRGVSAAVAALGLGGAAWAQELYVTMSNGPTLLHMDGPTGVVIDSLPILGATDLGRGLALRWDGMLFTTDQVDNQDRLFRIDPDTGQGQVIGGAALPGFFFAMAADPNTGRLYGAINNDLYSIDHTTGEATLIGTMEDPNLDVVFAMAIGRDGVAYITDGWHVALLRVDLATAAAEFVCHIGSQQWFDDMAFDEDGMLWGTRAYGVMQRGDVHACSLETLYDFYASGIEVVPGGDGCYPDCTLDGGLDLFDFLCFINGFNAGNPYSDCTGDGELDLFDFLCFVNNFNAGC